MDRLSGEGGIRTHGGPEGHNGFRDRPDQPLRHLSINALIIPETALNFYFFTPIRVAYVSKAFLAQQTFKRAFGIFFAVYQEERLDRG